MGTQQQDMDRTLAASIGSLDMDQVSADYWQQDEFVYVPEHHRC